MAVVDESSDVPTEATDSRTETRARFGRRALPGEYPRSRRVDSIGRTRDARPFGARPVGASAQSACPRVA